MQLSSGHHFSRLGSWVSSPIVRAPYSKYISSCWARKKVRKLGIRSMLRVSALMGAVHTVHTVYAIDAIYAIHTVSYG